MQEQSLFIEALERGDPAEQAAFLELACAGDPELRARIDKLLQRHRETGGPLDAACDTADNRADPPVEGPGTVIGPYKLLEQIGEGGFGVVFLAEQLRPVCRKVALKALKPGMDTRQVVARFEAERQALALMDHPNIAQVFDAGATGRGRPYFVMELVRGVPITDYCDQNRLSIRQRLDLFVTVCLAIQHAHQKGIIHRDIKPSNVLVTLRDNVPAPKVIDFGIAKAIAQDGADNAVVTNFAQMLGTPLYMSPEQAQPGAIDVDTRADIYSLGVLLYELLTGATPCGADRLKTAGYDEIRRIIREEEPAMPSARVRALGDEGTVVCAKRSGDPRRLGQLLRGELDAIVMKALDKDRNRRYETAGAFVADVRRYLHNEPVLACPPSRGYRFRKMLRRHKGGVLAASLVLLALIGGIVGVSWALIRAIDAEDKAVTALAERETALDSARESEGKALDHLFVALLHQVQARRSRGEEGQRFANLEALAKAADIARKRRYGDEAFLKLRTEAVACLALPDLRVEKTLLAKVPNSYWLAFDPEFHYFVWADLDGSLCVRRVADGVETARLPGPGIPPRWMRLVFSPNGQWLEVQTTDPDGAEKNVVWEFREGKVGRSVVLEHWCNFSPDSRFLAGPRADESSIGFFETASAKEVRRIEVRAGSVGFRPDGRQVAVYLGSEGNPLAVLDAETGKEVARYVNPPQAGGEAAWRSDGRLLAVACNDQKIYVWDHANKRLQSILEGHRNNGIKIAFTRTGDYLISTSWDGTTRLWDPVNGLELLHEQDSDSQDVHLCRDGRQLAVVKKDGRLVLCELSLAAERRTLHHGMVGNRTPRPEDVGPDTVAFSPDGRFLISGSRDGAQLWDMATFSEVGRLPEPTASALFHPDGASLFTHGTEGLRRWPIQRKVRNASKSDATEAIKLGPPAALDVPGAWQYANLECDRSGRWLSAVDLHHRRAIVLDLCRPAKLVLEHPGMCGCKLSPDGRWAATYDLHCNTTRLWDTAEGKAVSWRPPAGDLIQFFTPDARFLVTKAEGDAPLRAWHVGSWRPGPGAPGPDPATPLLRPAPDHALFLGHGFAPHDPLLLIHATTGKTIATLKPPYDANHSSASFSPDGTQLAIATGNHTIHIWDLRAIRRGLAEIGLDWDLPPYAPAERAAATAPVIVEALEKK